MVCLEIQQRLLYDAMRKLLFEIIQEWDKAINDWKKGSKDEDKIHAVKLLDDLTKAITTGLDRYATELSVTRKLADESMKEFVLRRQQYARDNETFQEGIEFIDIVIRMYLFQVVVFYYKHTKQPGFRQANVKPDEVDDYPPNLIAPVVSGRDLDKEVKGKPTVMVSQPKVHMKPNKLE